MKTRYPKSLLTRADLQRRSQQNAKQRIPAGAPFAITADLHVPDGSELENGKLRRSYYFLSLLPNQSQRSPRRSRSDVRVRRRWTAEKVVHHMQSQSKFWPAFSICKAHMMSRMTAVMVHVRAAIFERFRVTSMTSCRRDPAAFGIAVAMAAFGGIFFTAECALLIHVRCRKDP